MQFNINLAQRTGRRTLQTIDYIKVRPIKLHFNSSHTAAVYKIHNITLFIHTKIFEHAVE
jgi:hypothetical protein